MTATARARDVLATLEPVGCSDPLCMDCRYAGLLRVAIGLAEAALKSDAYIDMVVEGFGLDADSLKRLKAIRRRNRTALAAWEALMREEEG